MHAASTSPATSARAASRSPPMWSPCSPTPTSKRRTSKSRPASRPARAEVAERDQRRLRGVDRTRRDATPLQLLDRLDVGVGADDDHRGQVAVGVAHGQRLDRASGVPADALGADPRQRRVPRDVDAPGGELFDLALVVRVQDVVEREVAVREPAPEPVPDRDDLRVVRHRAHHQRFADAVAHAVTSPRSGRPVRARPTMSWRAWVVGAMTRRRARRGSGARCRAPCGTRRRRTRPSPGR